MQRILLIFFYIATFSIVAQGQREAANWRFGVQAGLAFPTVGNPVAVSGSALTNPGREGCSAISDAAGNLLCYTNAEQVWDRNNTAMPNGNLQYSNVSATQGALLLPAPGNPQQVYLFTVDAVENNLVGRLRYSIVDMNLRGGLGAIGAVKEVPVPVPGNVTLTEKLTAIRHVNGRDYWIVVHAYGSNAFFSYLLTPSGLTIQPVISNQGRMHIGGGGSNGNGNAVGYMRASPSGQKLAVAIREVALEVFDFSPSTGQVSNLQPVAMTAPFFYGAEFSPDGSKLYVSDLTGNSIRQVDLQSLPLRAQAVGSVSNYTGAIQQGLDGKLYVAVELSNYLAVINNPNGTAATCGLVANGFLLGNAQGRQGLPNFPNAYAPVLPVLEITAQLTACAGENVPMSGLASIVPAGTSFTWNFGDPASGSANITSGSTTNHRYQTAGNYTITLTVSTPAGTQTAQRTITIAPAPLVNLGLRQRLICQGQSVVLSSPTSAAGTTYRWTGGSTAASLTVSSPGRYVLTVTSPQGCQARDSVEVQAAPLPVVTIGPDQTVCEGGFPVQLRTNAQPTGSTFRWQDGTTGETFTATVPGNYSVEVRNAAGCLAVATAKLAIKSCVPILIPNVITPNNDRKNQFFVLQGLDAAQWAIHLYNRWGREIYVQQQYNNSWDATGQSAGMYYYLLTNAVTGQEYKGWLEVIK